MIACLLYTSNPELTKQVIAEYGAERIVIGVDGKNGKVAAEGWLDQSDVPMTDLIGAMVEGGAKYFIVTDVDRDGTMPVSYTHLRSYGSARNTM